MIKKLFILMFFVGYSLQAQHHINGFLKNNDKVTRIILYKVEGFEQKYVNYTLIQDNRFGFNLDKNAQPGVYRLLYKADKTEFLDFIYNNEDIELSFSPKNPAETIRFTKSTENNIFKRYAEATAIPQSKLDSLQLLYFRSSGITSDAKIRQEYTKYLKRVVAIQKQFEDLSKGMLSYYFIKSSKRYNASMPFKEATKYLAAIKEHFFDAIDFNNPQLLNSTLINDRIIDFIFYVNVSQYTDTQNNLFKKSINTVFSKITNPKLKKELVYNLIKRFSNKENKVITKFLMTNYFDKLPVADRDMGFKNSVMKQMKTAVNSKAPNITWQDFSGNHDLYSLKSAKYYVVLFWSSTCSHCLHEIPILYKYIKDKKDIKVIAVGLESGPNPWNKEMQKYPNFIHVFGANKWRNKFSKAYNIHATPTYIILDANKNIVSKPYGEADVKKFFDNLKM